MNYTVRYKIQYSLFWKTIPNVKGDGIMTSETNYPARFFITSDEERIEVPIPGTIFWFSKERYASIVKKNTLEGQP